MEHLRKMVAILNIGVASESVTGLSPVLKRHGAGIISEKTISERANAEDVRWRAI